MHQFIACLSVCHSDAVNHPKSKQVFTLMDTGRRGQLRLEDFIRIFHETGDGDKLGPKEQSIIERYIEENRDIGDEGLRQQHIEEFLAENDPNQ